jgi:hypothetical protein
LHLEARYNYENLDTGSMWFGYNFAGGETVEWTLTPIIGGVFGQTDGVAPGYKGSLIWRQLEVYSEGEYVFDAHDSADSFFYNWSEVTFVPAEWFRVGLVTQRDARLRDRTRHPARSPRRLHLQGTPGDDLRLQPGRQRSRCRVFSRVQFLMPGVGTWACEIHAGHSVGSLSWRFRAARRVRTNQAEACTKPTTPAPGHPRASSRPPPHPHGPIHLSACGS